MTQNLPRFTILIGLLLTLLALAGYFGGRLTGTEYASWTALIPAFVGVPILLCGVIALQVSAAGRKHVMHLAMMFGLLGAIAAVGGIYARVINADTTPTWLAQLSLFGMLVLCVMLIIVGVRSFIAARKARERGE